MCSFHAWSVFYGKGYLLLKNLFNGTVHNEEINECKNARVFCY